MDGIVVLMIVQMVGWSIIFRSMAKMEKSNKLDEEEKEVCYRYKRCEDCPEFEKYYYYDGICYYVYFREIKVSENGK